MIPKRCQACFPSCLEAFLNASGLYSNLAAKHNLPLFSRGTTCLRTGPGCPAAVPQTGGQQQAQDPPGEVGPHTLFSASICPF